MNPAARLRGYGTGSRIVGIDVARGLAVLGMFGAHVGVQEPFDWVDPGTWTDVVNGRSSILFAVLAGVSIAIITGRDRPVEGVPLVQARVRILVRAVIIFAVGALLELLGTPVAVILPYYAVLFAASLPFLRWPPKALLFTAVFVALAMPVAIVPIRAEGVQGAGPGKVFVDLLATGSYPTLVWMAFLLAGLGIGRLALGALRTQLLLLTCGVGLAVLGYGAGVLVTPLQSSAGTWAALFTVAPHSGSPFEVIGSGGFAIAVIGVCLLLARTVARWVVLPIAAVGSMALSAYSVQLIAFALLLSAQEPTLAGPDLDYGDGLWLAFVGVALLACTAWFVLLGKGPLEVALAVVADWAARPTPGRIVPPPADRLDAPTDAEDGR